jgi:Leucine Rich repeat
MAGNRSRRVDESSPIHRGRVAVTIAILLATAPVGCTSDPQAEARDQALATIQKLGGRFERDRNLDGEPVVKVDFTGRPVGDADLKALQVLKRLNALVLRGTQVTDAGMPLVRTMGKLRSLNLDGCHITDASLADLSGLTSLRGLYLEGTGVTDAGLASLSPLTKLWGLSLRDTGVTDAGLVHLRGLTTLRQLDLEGARVSAAGIASLRKDLPQVRILVGAREREDRGVF